MRVSKTTGFSFLFIAFAVITAFGAAQAQDAQTVEKPNLKVGDSWTYVVLEPISKAQQSTIDLVVSEVSDTQLKMTNKSGEVVASYDADLAAMTAAISACAAPLPSDCKSKGESKPNASRDHNKGQRSDGN